MGRPRMTEQREEEIVDAFLELVATRGLEETTLDDVARAVDLGRGTVRHFVGNRDDLSRLATSRLIERYTAELVSAVLGSNSSDPLETLLDFLFISGQEELEVEERAFDALIGMAPQDPRLRTELAESYAVFEQTVETVLRASFPDAANAAIADVSYGVMCIAEKSGELLTLGLPADRRDRALTSARILVASLASG